jgi:branched-chain amino acid transport system ATP-binding protein
MRHTIPFCTSRVATDTCGGEPAVATELFGQFRILRDEGVTLLIVDQMADHVLAVADRAYVLGGGRVVAQGSAAEMRDKIMDDTYLGARPAAVNQWT